MDEFLKNGYVFLKSIYKVDDLEKIKNEFFNFLSKNNVIEELNKKEDVRKNNYYVNNTYTLLNSYQKMQYYYLPVFDNRSGHNRITDKGVIDVFNIHKILPSINEVINLDVILSILKKLTKKDWKFLRINLQVNNNVINPNNYHFDNSEIIKFTIYLNDIKEINGGGLSFISNSHINNKFNNKNIKNFYGNCGDVLISYQNGMHKKLPQINSINYFLVLNFEVKN